MRIGVWLDADYNPEEGGGFSYYDKLVRSIDTYDFHESLDFCFVSTGNIEKLSLKRQCVHLKFTPSASFMEKLKCHLPLIGDLYKTKRQQRISQEQNSAFIHQLQMQHIDVIYYLRQGECHVRNFPFVATNWDIGHCSTWAFPELIYDGQFERRSHFYNTILPKALMVFAESEAGKSELMKYTHISEKKIRVVPLFAGICVEDVLPKKDQLLILDMYNLYPHKFFFYPAQFWAHKNHIGLLMAFAKFKDSHPEYKLVLTGADKGNLLHVKSIIDDMCLADSVVFPGFVPMSILNTFYTQSTALVMASYFGPTNMPPIEAMYLGCPVICSDLAGHREILGDAAIYFDATATDSIVNAMESIIQKREEYLNKLALQLQHSQFTIDVALSRINQYMFQLQTIRSNWK